MAMSASPRLLLNMTVIILKILWIQYQLLEKCRGNICVNKHKKVVTVVFASWGNVEIKCNKFLWPPPPPKNKINKNKLKKVCTEEQSSFVGIHLGSAWPLQPKLFSSKDVRCEACHSILHSDTVPLIYRCYISHTTDISLIWKLAYHSTDIYHWYHMIPVIYQWYRCEK